MRMTKRLGMMLILATLMAAPRVASAEMLDILWEMSGPRMIGLVSHCKIALTQRIGKVLDEEGKETDLDLKLPRTCYNATLFGLPVLPKGFSTKAADSNDQKPADIWLNLAGAVYFSTSHDDDPEDRAVYGVAVEPLVEFANNRSQDDGYLVFHGVGVGWQRFWGSAFDSFDKFLFKFRPVGVSYKRVEITYNLRIYPSGFHPSDFGIGPPPVGDRPTEIVHGINFGIHPW